MEQIKCPQCGRMYPEDAAFCPSCKCPNELFIEQEKRDKQEVGENEQDIQEDILFEDQEIEEEQGCNVNNVNNVSLFTPNAEPILNKYGIAIKYIGLSLMIASFVVALVYIVLAIKIREWPYLVGALKFILVGGIVYIACIVIKAFIDVFVNISVTLQNIDSKTKHPSEK